MTPARAPVSKQMMVVQHQDGKKSVQAATLPPLFSPKKFDNGGNNLHAVSQSINDLDTLANNKNVSIEENNSSDIVTNMAAKMDSEGHTL